MYRFISDPGHGWLEVTQAEIDSLGLTKEISAYSYRRGKMVYLEEDGDMGKFLRAYKAREGVDPEIREEYQEVTPIRGYADY